MPNLELQDKVLLITGATGIAAATAVLAAQNGASLCIASRTQEHGEALRARLGQAGHSCAYVQADLTHPDAAERIVRFCIGTHGRIDAAFQVAGVSGRRLGDGPAHECTEQGWDAVMDTNAKGMFLLCGALIRQMLRQPVASSGLRGTLLNMSSVLGWSPSPRHFATHVYAASKAAIIGFSRAMAAYYAAQKIRVNVIAPALVRTPMSERAQHDPAILNFIRSKQPLAGDLLAEDQVARAALFLLADSSAMITGDVLTVDAGWCVSEGPA